MNVWVSLWVYLPLVTAFLIATVHCTDRSPNRNERESMPSSSKDESTADSPTLAPANSFWNVPHYSLRIPSLFLFEKIKHRIVLQLPTVDFSQRKSQPLDFVKDHFDYNALFVAHHSQSPRRLIVYSANYTSASSMRNVLDAREPIKVYGITCEPNGKRMDCENVELTKKDENSYGVVATRKLSRTERYEVKLQYVQHPTLILEIDEFGWATTRISLDNQNSCVLEQIYIKSKRPWHSLFFGKVHNIRLIGSPDGSEETVTYKFTYPKGKKAKKEKSKLVTDFSSAFVPSDRPE